MEYNMKHNMTPVKYNEWLDTKIKIPFKKALAEIVDASDCEFGMGFVSLECLAYEYLLIIPNRKERQMSVIKWFIRNIDDLTYDTRDAIQMMQESRLETINRAIKDRRKMNERVQEYFGVPLD